MLARFLNEVKESLSMRLKNGISMKLALAQINPTVGDISGNSEKIKQTIRQAAGQGAELVIFSELSLVGYPPKDLLMKPRFIDDNLAAMEEIAQGCGDCAALVGFVARHEGPSGKSLHNAAALLHKGKIGTIYYKQLLPTYDVFDERRYFQPADSEQIIELDGKRIGLTICEDIWQSESGQTGKTYELKPLQCLAEKKVDWVVNMSASPFNMGKHAFRRQLFAGQCRKYNLPLIYVNQVGGNDDLVFDGCSCAFDADGTPITQAKSFAEDLLLLDMDRPEAARCETVLDNIPSIHDALTLGLRDYIHKCGFERVVLGLSGGIDSALTAALAVEALGAENVLGVALPSRYSSEHSLADAKALAQNLNIEFIVISIEQSHAAMEATMSEVFAGLEPDITEENIQARLRGAILMALSNKFRRLLLTTGNKSEMAVGYCTLYGDMNGGLAVISDVPKTMVYELARYINRNGELIPENTIAKPPSAELRPDQKDTDSLPDYAVLDDILQRYIEQDQSPAEIVAAGFDEATVKRIIRLVDISEYKRKQAPPGLKVTSRAFGTGRRMPIAQNYRP